MYQIILREDKLLPFTKKHYNIFSDKIDRMRLEWTSSSVYFSKLWCHNMSTTTTLKVKFYKAKAQN